MRIENKPQTPAQVRVTRNPRGTKPESVSGAETYPLADKSRVMNFICSDVNCPMKVTAPPERCPKCYPPTVTTSDTRSWYCHKCAVEVYDRRCPHCGKLEDDES